MNVLIDGNIILDVLQNREPHIEASSKVWKLCETNLVNGYVSALTFADMVYVMRKELTPAKIYEVLKKLALIFHFTELSISDMEKAAGMMWKDYEDAVQAATAERIRATAIITRNIKDYQQYLKGYNYTGVTPVLIDFYATWCGPCQALSPIIEQLASDYEGRLKVLKVDVDKNQALAMAARIQSIPTLFLINKAGEIERLVGGRPYGELAKRIDSIIDN